MASGIAGVDLDQLLEDLALERFRGRVLAGLSTERSRQSQERDPKRWPAAGNSGLQHDDPG
jgi:hypothetical protein